MAINYDFQRLTDRAAFVATLGIDDAAFDRVINFAPPLPVEQREVSSATTILEMPEFLRHDIPKRNPARGYRVVWEPFHTMAAYKRLARRLHVFFGAFLNGYPHDLAFGYRPKRNIKENASVHLGHKHLLSLDVEDFFPSITSWRIRQLLETLAIAPDVSEALAGFVTIGGTLPLGLPTSPAISNAVLLPVDEALSKLANDVGASYSRYSDDICFSGDGQLPEVGAISLILASEGFRIAESKTARSKLGQSHYVTGLSVSDPDQPHAPRAKKRRLRQELYYARRFGLHGHLNKRGINDPTLVQQQVNRLDGQVKFIAHHEPRMASALKDEWRKILVDAGLRPSFVPKNQHMPPFSFFVDEAEFRRGDKIVLALGMVATQHPEAVYDATRQVQLRLINDLWADGDVQRLIDVGLHFTENTQDQRLAYVNQLTTMPVQAYVAYRELDHIGDYETTYLALLATMLPRRLMAAESKFATFIFERNPKVSQTAISSCVESAHQLLEQRKNRRPLAVITRFASKPHEGISAVDYFLGTLGRYLNSASTPHGRPESRDSLMFDRLRDSYRVIFDASSGVEYTRRNPIVPWS